MSWGDGSAAVCDVPRSSVRAAGARGQRLISEAPSSSTQQRPTHHGMTSHQPSGDLLEAVMQVCS